MLLHMENKDNKNVIKVPNLMQSIPSLACDKKVGIYCRISTKNRNQITSLGTQVNGAIDVILTNPLYKLYNVYIDVESGKSMAPRRQFNQMIQDCKDGKMNYIVTKSISRFSRNIVDTLNIIRELKQYKVGICFQLEKIDTEKIESEFLVSILTAAYQCESENKSENIKWGNRAEIIKGNGKILNRKCYGYKYDDNRLLAIDEKEAKIVKKIFELYINGYSILKITKYLKSNNIKSPRGKNEWSKRAVETIITNEKYIGDIKTHKTFMGDYPNTRRFTNRGEHEQYYISSHHPAIIDKETFKLVEKIRKERSNMEIDSYGFPKRRKKRYSSK